LPFDVVDLPVFRAVAISPLSSLAGEAPPLVLFLLLTVCFAVLGLDVDLVVRVFLAIGHFLIITIFEPEVKVLIAQTFWGILVCA
jgi:hypothetical protein